MAAPASTEVAAVESQPDGWQRPVVSRTTLGVLAGLVVLFNLPLIHYYVFRGSMAATAQVPYQNDFADPASVGRDFWSTGGLWRVENGQLVSPGVKNNPLWLRAKLPQNVAVDFDVRSMGSAMGAGDTKVEIFGDGTDHATGYVLIHGGWNNTVSIIARLDEHAPAWGALQSQAQEVARAKGLPAADLVQTGVYTPRTRVRVEGNPYPVENGRTYHWRIERRQGLITWSIDGREFMRFDDPMPLTGDGHDRFGFSSWESQLYFDNLKIQPL